MISLLAMIMSTNLHSRTYKVPEKTKSLWTRKKILFQTGFHLLSMDEVQGICWYTPIPSELFKGTSYILCFANKASGLYCLAYTFCLQSISSSFITTIPLLIRQDINSVGRTFFRLRQNSVIDRFHFREFCSFDFNLFSV